MLNNVLCYLEKSAEDFPHKVAFCDELKSITFCRLVECAKALGTKIARAVGDSSLCLPVAVMASRSVDTIVCFMAVLYAGCCYAPIDSDMPAARAKALLENLNPALILCTDKAGLAAAENVGLGTSIMQVDTDDISCECDAELLYRIRENRIDTDPVYIIHTSGSTGVPKGIVISHASVIDFIEWMSEEIGFSDKDVFANQAPFFFDLSVKDLYLTLRHGATDYIIPKKLFMFPALLVDYLDQNKVTSLTWATSAFNLVAMSGILDKKAPGYLEKVVLGGEALWGKNLNAWRRNLPEVRYVNLYGPTEVTVDCTCYIIEKQFEDTDAIPIGKACKNKQVLLVDENLLPVPDGTPGEICVRGKGLSAGYYNDKQKTDLAFVQNPAIKAYRDILYRTGDIGVRDCDGNITFKTRKDGQIKHMGYRIELGEIERALNGIAQINEAICFYDGTAGRIVAVYTEAENSATEAHGNLAKMLSESLPKYMIPNIYIKLDSMPYTNGGKIDRVKIKNDYLSKK